MILNRLFTALIILLATQFSYSQSLGISNESSTGDLLITKPDGTELFRTEFTSGYVGIGTINPSYILHLEDDAVGKMGLLIDKTEIGKLGSLELGLGSAGNTNIISSLDMKFISGTNSFTFDNLGTGIVKSTTGLLSSVTESSIVTNGGAITSFSAGNGLTATTSSNTADVNLGGTLNQNTTISQGINDMIYNLDGTGDFKIQNSGTTVFTVDDGNIGITNDNSFVPIAKLHVDGTTQTNSLNINDYSMPSSDGTAGQMFQTNGSGTISFSSLSFPISDGANGQYMTTDGSGNLGWNSPSWIVSGTNQYSAVANNVGIGTITPKGKLNLMGGTDAAAATADGGYLLIGDPAGSHIAMDNNEIMQKSDGTTAGNLYLQNDGGNLITNVAGGNVGIGVISPNNKLEIGPATARALIGNAYVGAWSVSSNYASFGNSDAPVDNALMQYNDGTVYLNHANGTKMFFNRGSVNQMQLNEDGNLGIGTSTIPGKLTIHSLTNTAIYNTVSSTSTNTKYANYNKINSTSTGAQYGVYNYSSNASSGVKTGLRNFITSTGNIFGTANLLTVNSGGTGTIYGTHSIISNSGSGTSYGLYSSNSGTSTSKYGLYITGEDENYFSGNIGIGTTTTSGKLTIDSNQDYSIYNINNSSTNNTKYGIYNRIYSPSTGTQFGINNINLSSSTSTKYGLWNQIIAMGSGSAGLYNLFTVNSGTSGTFYGVRNNVTNNASGTSFIYYGAHSGSNSNNFGIFISGENKNYLSSKLGIGIPSPNVALDVNGDIEYTGTITDVSDRRLKENFEMINSVSEKLNSLQAYKYNMIADSLKTEEYGLIAQDVQKVFPEMVSYIDNSNNYLGLSYVQLIPILVEAHKEQQAIIENLKEEVTTLKKELANQNDNSTQQIERLRQEFKTELNEIKTQLNLQEKVEK